MVDPETVVVEPVHAPSAYLAVARAAPDVTLTALAEEALLQHIPHLILEALPVGHQNGVDGVHERGPPGRHSQHQKGRALEEAESDCGLGWEFGEEGCEEGEEEGEDQEVGRDLRTGGSARAGRGLLVLLDLHEVVRVIE